MALSTGPVQPFLQAAAGQGEQELNKSLKLDLCTNDRQVLLTLSIPMQTVGQGRFAGSHPEG